MARKKTIKSVIGKRYDSMMGRCYRSTERGYSHYGGKGIRVCEAWLMDIDTFREWFIEALPVSVEEFMSNTRKYQIDRIDSTGHYTPDNCRIVTAQVNTRNRTVGVVNQVISAEGTVVNL